VKTRFLISDSTPEGVRLEEMLRAVRNDILIRCSAMMDDGREAAEQVMANNMQILPLLSEAIHLAEDSTEILSRSFGEESAAKGHPT